MKLVTDRDVQDFEVLDRIEARRMASPEVQEQMDRDAESGQLLTDKGEPLDAETEKRVRRRLLDRFGHLTEAPTFSEYVRQREGASRWLLPGLWPADTIPMLSGNHKAGKTTVVADLVASLVVPGRKFLGRFGPVEGTPEVYLINAETPTDAMRKALLAAGVPVDDEHLVVDDLEPRGGAHLFDITQPALYDRWIDLIRECMNCGPGEHYEPDVLIVDGLTAILGGETDRYAKWYAAFRRFVREVGASSALVTGHSTMDGKHSMGGVEMLGGPDGLWTYWSSDPDNPTSRRYFKVQPRLGGAVVPKTEVRLVDGLLTASENAEESTGNAESPNPRTEVLERLQKASSDGATATDLTGRGRFGSERRKALHSLQTEGVVTSRAEGRSTRWWLTEHAPTDTIR
ncbi:AAA family ATPase [Brachybacterium tyrofermentans]|uniref:AAA family ATPase n=1 Tax=Brachybacterium tyrofermentans TaxID=47848 RepID=UPI003F90CF70